jgi:hypothetical protein
MKTLKDFSKGNYHYTIGGTIQIVNGDFLAVTRTPITHEIGGIHSSLRYVPIRPRDTPMVSTRRLKRADIIAAFPER